MGERHHEEIFLTPLRSEFGDYSWEALRADLCASLSVAFLTIPQAMAYSLVAKLPLFCGLFASIFSAMVTTLFSSSRHLVVGPSNATALLVLAATSELLFSHYRALSEVQRVEMSLQLLMQLTLLVGLFQMIAAACKLGRLTHFVSHSVIVGYLSGVALAVFINQLQTFLGLPPLPGSGFTSLYQRGAYILSHFHLIHWPTAWMGLASLSLLIAIKQAYHLLPAGVIVLIGAGLLAHAFGLSSYTEEGFFGFVPHENAGKVSLIGDIGQIYPLFPSYAFASFDWGVINQLVPFAFAIALISALESSSVAKSIATRSGERISINQEIFSLGLGNLFSSFVTALPLSASPTRSALLCDLGSKTRLAVLFTAFFSLLLLLLLGMFIHRIPLATLAALLILNAAYIVNKRQFLLCLKATGSDAFVLIITFLSCLFFSLHIAFYIGVISSITLYLKKAAMPHLVECTIDESGKIGNADLPQKEHFPIRLINVQGELFFGAADLFQNTLKALATSDEETKVLILRLKNARDIDATTCLALQQLHDYLKRSHRHLIACGLTEQYWEILCNSGVAELIGKENLFLYDEKQPQLTVQKALARAKALISLEL